MYVAVDAPEEGEIRVERRDVGVEGVIDLYRDDVVAADVHVGRHIVNERRKTTLMLADEIAVHINIRNDVRSVEFEEQPPSRFVGADGVVQAIPANPTVVIIASVLPIEVVPRMRQIQQRPRGIVETVRLRAGDVLADEPPPRVEIDVFAWIGWRRIRLTENSRSRNRQRRHEKK